MSPTDQSRIVAFGKIPTYGDFVQLNCAGPVWGRFDEWLQDATGELRHAHGNEFKALLSEVPPFRFLFSVREAGGIVTGVVHPSRDRVGRFAFLVLARVKQAAASPIQDASLPLSAQAFYAEAENVAARGAAGGLSEDALVSAVMALPTESPHTVGNDRGLVGDEVILSELRQSIGTVRQDRLARFTLSFRLPVVHQVAERSVSNWLSAAINMVDSKEQSNPCAFWHEHPDGEPGGSLILSISQPSPKMLLSVVDESSEHDQVVSLVEAG